MSCLPAALEKPSGRKTFRRRAEAAERRESAPPHARSSTVPRYYFNLCSEEGEVTDVMGEPCADDLAALSIAFRKAGDIVQNRLFRNTAIEEAWIEVEDETERTILTLPLRSAAY
jgi:hypothetical protein